jgi:23S rRNA pseudouridine2605 synthase
MFSSTLPNHIFRSCSPAVAVQRRTLNRFYASSSFSNDNNAVINIKTTTIDNNDRDGTSTSTSTSVVPVPVVKDTTNCIRLSKLLSHDSANLTLSRRQAERHIRDGQVTLAGKIVTIPQTLVAYDEITSISAKNSSPLLKLKGKPVIFNPSSSITSSSSTDNQHEKSIKVWAVHKVSGEVVAENDPHNRPSLMERLQRSGVGKSRKGGKLHLKPIGRLDIPTEGLMLITNDGDFSREMELPSNKIHRIYRARVHGRLTSYKLDRIRKGGIEFDNVRYSAMKVAIEKPKRSNKPTSTNTWLKVTCTEGKNRQIRNVFKALGLSVTRLIRIQYGDYKLDTIPAGMAIPIPYKAVTYQKAKGQLYIPSNKNKNTGTDKDNKKIQTATPVTWISSVQ